MAATGLGFLWCFFLKLKIEQLCVTEYQGPNFAALTQNVDTLTPGMNGGAG